MIEENPTKSKRSIRPTQSMRERSLVASTSKKKTRRVKRTANAIASPIKTAHKYGQKMYFLPMPDNKFGSFLNKRRYFIPKYFREAWHELKDVKWPNRKDTAKLTLAVFIFAIIFGILVAVTDYGLDKVFKKVLLK